MDRKQLHRQLYILQKPTTRARRNALYYTYNIYNLFMLIYIWGQLGTYKLLFTLYDINTRSPGFIKIFIPLWVSTNNFL